MEKNKLTAMQMGMVYNSLLLPSSGVDIEQIICRSGEELNPEFFFRAWKELIAFHSALRVVFEKEQNGDFCQWVLSDFNLLPTVKDISHLIESEQKTIIDDFLVNDRHTDFDMGTTPLHRFTLFLLGKSTYLWVWTFHHALIDGRSFASLVAELYQRYNSLVFSKNLDVPDSKEMPDLIEAVNIKAASLLDSGEYWKKLLDGFGNSNQPAIRKPQTVGNKYFVRKYLTEEDSRSWNQYAQNKNVSINTLLQAGWAILLSTYSNEDDVVFGSTLSTRYPLGEDARDAVGLFINTLPLRVLLSGDMLLSDLVGSVRSQALKLRELVLTPLSFVQQQGGVENSRKLFDSIVVYEKASLGNMLKNRGSEWLTREVEYLGKTSFSLALLAYGGDQIELKLEFDPAQYEVSAIERMIACLVHIINQIVSNDSKPLLSLSFITSDQQCALHRFNDTAEDYPLECLHTQFENQVLKTPDAIAVIDQKLTVTYNELNCFANGVSEAIRNTSHGDGQGIVGICCARSYQLIGGMLGILKSGSAYLPLDPNYPVERLLFMVEDTQCKVVLVDENSEHLFKNKDFTLLRIEKIPSLQEYVRSTVSHSSLGYLIYTSGSTGKPKGVAIEHHSASALIEWSYKTYSSLTNMLAATSICFDLSVFEIFGPLARGGTIILADNVLALSTLPEASQVEIINTVPSAIAALLEQKAVPPSCHTIILAGELLKQDLVDKIYEQTGVSRVCDQYGPSEDTTYSTYALRTRHGRQSIGVPIANTQFYMLDKLFRPVPIGVTGEMYISGVGLARGYLNRPELTAEKFLPNPFLPSISPIMYRTGDLGRWYDDGEIEYIGRIDHQIKLRGYRIELGEIEKCIMRYDQVENTVVVVREDVPGGMKLVAYITPEMVDVVLLKKSLQELLPEFMVPQAFVCMNTFPMTSNGKIDRKKLPAPQIEIAESEGNVVLSDTENRLLTIWKRVLNNDHIGPNQSFFDIGGHSILAVKMFSGISQEFKINLPLSTLLKALTVRDLSMVIDEYLIPVSQNHIKDDHWDCFVPFNTSKGRIPFVCIHAVGGNVLNYRIFNGKIGKSQPLYGFQSFGLDGFSAPDSTIEKMAARYVKYLIELNPEGPFVLGGGSMGGYIAFEMTKQLQEIGKKILPVIMFDTHGPGQFNKVIKQEEGNRGISLIVQFKKSGFIALFNRISIAIARRLFLFIALGPLRGLFFRTLRFFSLSIPQLWRPWLIQENNLRAALKYSPKPINAKLILLSDSRNLSGNTLLKGWEGYFLSGIKVIGVPADHGMFIEHPSVAIELKNLLAEINDNS